MPSTTRWSSMILCCSKFTWKSQAVNCSGPWSLGHFSIHWHEWCWCCSCQKWSQSVETIWQEIQGDITRGRQRWLNRHNQYSVFLEEWKKCECVTLKRSREVYKREERRDCGKACLINWKCYVFSVCTSSI